VGAGVGDPLLHLRHRRALPRSVVLSEGEQLMAIAVDPFMGTVPTIHIKRVRKGERERESHLGLPMACPRHS